MQFAKTTKKPRLVMVFDCSNYIVSLNIDLTTRKQSFMHFFDMNINISFVLNETPVKQLFSKQEIDGILKYQKILHQNKQVTYRESVFFTIADLHELPSSKFDNIFLCNNDEIVIKKAKELGVYIAIQRTDLPQQTALIHEVKTDKQNNKILDLYCFSHFEKHENQDDNGFMYIRFHNAIPNLDKVDNFFNMIFELVGDVDKAIFMETLENFKMN
jgi:hypothetical protein